jgi:hypothetical protein
MDPTGETFWITSVPPFLATVCSALSKMRFSSSGLAMAIADFTSAMGLRDSMDFSGWMSTRFSASLASQDVAGRAMD